MHLLRRFGLGVPVALAIGVWILGAGFGTTSIGAELAGRVRAERLPEDVQRNSAWSPIYGFADVCQAEIPQSADVLLVDPTGSPASVPESMRTGPAAFGLPGDLDWANQAVFAYVLYPRSISAIGHLPSNWPAESQSARYVALWEQHAYRSAEARAAGNEAEADLASQPNALRVCSYSSQTGDRGLVYALGAVGSAAGPSIPSAPWGGRAGAYLRVLFGLGCAWAIGFVLLRLLPRARLPVAFTLGAALPLGCAAITLELIGFSIARIAWSAPVLAAPWIGCAVVAGWQARHQIAGARYLSLPTPTSAWRRLHATERAALAALAAFVLVIVAGAPLGLPWSDGFNLYYFKSRAFFADGSVLPYYEHAGGALFTFPAHPPLVSLAVTWLYLFVGQVDEHVTLLLWPALFISMLLILYALARVRLSRRLAIWFVLGSALIGYEVSTQALLASFADLPVAVFLLLAVGALWLWASDEPRRPELLALAGIFLGGASLAKEEGLVAALLILGATPLLATRGTALAARSRLVPLSIALPAFALMAVPWLLLRAKYHLPEMTVHMGMTSALLGRLPAAASGLGMRAALPLLPFAALALIAAVTRPASSWRLLSGRFWFVVVITVMMLGVDVAAVAAAPVEVHHQLSIAGTRLVSQVLPLAFVASIDVWLLIAPRGRLLKSLQPAVREAVSHPPA